MTTKQSRLTTFEHQIRRLDKRLVSLRRVSDQISALRLAIFAGGFVLAFIANFAVGEWAFWLTSAITIVAFALAVRIHRRILRSIAEVTTWRQIKARQIARMTLDWAHIPLPLPQSDDPLSVDLDLVGERSIHHLLDTAISYEGSQRLRDWLLNTQPNPQTIAQRQALVKELLILPLFRDKLNLRGRLASAGAGRQWKVKRVLDWFDQQAPTSSLRPTLQLLTVLACINIALFALSAMTNFPSFWVVTLLVYLTILFVKSRDLAGLFEAVLSVQDALSKLSAVFSHLEKYPYRRESRLKSLCQPFLDSTNRPSAQLRRIARVATAVSVTHTPSLWLLINAVVPWDMYFAHLLNGYKAEITALLPDWLEVWIELEALSSLANFGTLNPEYTFPDIAANTSQSPVLEARQLGHPLLTEDHKICNDFTVDKLGQVITITGSNMSGKSTFLRTLGINLCLAYAGSPVNAVALRTAPFRVFTCIRVSDSVTDGFSYFYSEVRRLKALLDALYQDDPLPLFFLIDEIFRGTNNQERLIGSRSYLRALVGRNGLGIISTHDLELTKLADETPGISNDHFREEVIDGRMVFDYKLHHGPCPTTNALTIMRLEGLPVDEPSEAKTR